VIEGGEEDADLFLTMWQRVKYLVPARTLVHRLKVISQVDVREWLPKLTIPCLYIQATSDRSVPASSIFDFTKSISDLRVTKIKGPHFILQAQPQASLTAIRKFVDLTNNKSSRQSTSAADQHVKPVVKGKINDNKDI
jgi:pimeloyl-ACP methyl ester carboxylesterase